MNSSAWLRLLRAHCGDKDGLSLPYLVGGSAYPTEAATIKDARTILGQMRSLDSSEGGVYLSRCARLQVPVFTLLPKGYGTGLKVGLDETWGKTDLQKIEKVLADAKDPIESAHFSRAQEDGIWCWRRFTPDERAWIASVLQNA